MSNLYLEQLDSVKQKSLRALEINRVVTPCKKFTYHQPSSKQYHNRQWLWDSCFHAVAYRHQDPEVAISEICALLEHQLIDGPNKGMIPHMRFWDQSLGRTTAFDYRDRSWITNPPLIASIALLVAEKIIDSELKRNFLEKVYNSVALFHDWFDRCRTFSDSALVVNIHPWETGRDAAIAWDLVLPLPEAFPQSVQKLFWERCNQTPAEYLEAERIRYANEKGEPDFNYKDSQHKSRCIVNKLVDFVQGDIYELRESFASFCVYAADFNSIRANDLQSLSEISKQLGFDPVVTHSWSNKAESVREAIRKTLWSSSSQAFVDVQLLPRGNFGWLPESAASFVAFFAAVPSDSQAVILLKKLLDPAKYCRQFLIPSEPAYSSSYDPNKYWRGNVWPSLQWLVWRGLLNCPNKSLRDKNLIVAVREKIVQSMGELVLEQGVYEYYNPETGAGGGEENQSWTAVVLDMIMSEIEVQKNECF